MTVIRHVIVRGRVQGVGYRNFVEQAARRLALEGWVRNRRDGSVEALFAGSNDQVEQMIAECRDGPPAARVEGIEEATGTTDQLSLRPQGSRFAVLATA
jgi:acylphosphatase